MRWGRLNTFRSPEGGVRGWTPYVGGNLVTDKETLTPWH